MELTYRIDCRELTSRAAAHDCFARVFALPAFYGRNLDALYDVLTELPPCTLLLEHTGCLYDALGPYAERSAGESKYPDSGRYQNFLSIFCTLSILPENRRFSLCELSIYKVRHRRIKYAI